jgi:GNAT superfamily N-acetyltransferase
MNIRAAQISDAAPMAALIRSHQALLTLQPSGEGAEEFVQSVAEPALRAHLEAGNYVHFVAEHGGALVGFVAVRDNAHLFHLFVAAAHQRKGAARQLWAQARRHAELHGNPGEFTVNSSLNALAVYERFGFKQEAPRVEKHGVAFVPMRLRSGGSGG